MNGLSNSYLFLKFQIVHIRKNQKNQFTYIMGKYQIKQISDEKKLMKIKRLKNKLRMACQNNIFVKKFVSFSYTTQISIFGSFRCSCCFVGELLGSILVSVSGIQCCQPFTLSLAISVLTPSSLVSSPLDAFVVYGLGSRLDLVYFSRLPHFFSPLPPRVSFRSSLRFDFVPILSDFGVVRFDMGSLFVST